MPNQFVASDPVEQSRAKSRQKLARLRDQQRSQDLVHHRIWLRLGAFWHQHFTGAVLQTRGHLANIRLFENATHVANHKLWRRWASRRWAHSQKEISNHRGKQWTLWWFPKQDFVHDKAIPPRKPRGTAALGHQTDDERIVQELREESLWRIQQ